MTPFGMGKKKRSFRETISHAIVGTPEERARRRQEEERSKRREHSAYLEAKIRERVKHARARGRYAGKPLEERFMGTAKSVLGNFDTGMGEIFGIPEPKPKRRRKR